MHRPTLTALLTAFACSGSLQAATITFDDLVTGATSYAFDGDGDGIRDVTFTTTDTGGFNTIGPGLNQSLIKEPGLEGTSLLTTDLRVDFSRGPTGTVSFAFALNSSVASSLYFANFRIFDARNALLGASTVAGAYTTTPFGRSSFPEGVVNVTFSGTAAYGLFDFNSQFGRYIIDDFTGNFGSVVPEPSTTWLLLAGACALLAPRLRRRLAARRTSTAS